MLYNSEGVPLGRMEHITVMQKRFSSKYVQVLPIAALSCPTNTNSRFLSVPKMSLTQRMLENSKKPQEQATHQLAFILRQVERLLRKNQ